MKKTISMALTAIILTAFIPTSAFAAEIPPEEIIAPEPTLTLITTETPDTEISSTEIPIEISPTNTETVTTTETEDTLEPDDPQTTTYLCLVQDGTIIDVLTETTGADYNYDQTNNELTLNNFVGETLTAESTSPFKLILIGNNVFKTDSGFAIDITADTTFTGDGHLTASGVPVKTTMGGGVNILGNLTIEDGTYDLNAVGNSDSSSAVALLVGYNEDDVIEAGNLTINGGTIKTNSYNDQYGGAFGLFAYGDLIINNGTLDVTTNSPNNYSRGIGASNDLIINGGNIKVVSTGGDATALFSYHDIFINNGTLDLYADGDVASAISAENNIFINDRYGDVDLTANKLLLTPLSEKTYEQTDRQAFNPETGNEPTTTSTPIVGTAMLLVILGALIVREIRIRV